MKRENRRTEEDKRSNEQEERGEGEELQTSKMETKRKRQFKVR